MENTLRAFHLIAVFWTEGRAEEVRCYSCSSGLCGVAVGLPLELDSVSRCRDDFFPSPGLPVASDGEAAPSLGAVVSSRPPGDGDAPGLPLAPRVPLDDGLAAVAPSDLGDAVACGLVDAVARGLAASVACGLGDALPAGEAVPAGDPVAAGDALTVGERAAVGDAPGLTVAPAAPATPVVVVVVPETPAPALTP